MFNRKYKKGMADAAKAYEAFGKKQEEALNHILEEVRVRKLDMEEDIKQLNGNIDGLYDYLRSKDKAKLYTVYTPFDIKELKEEEKLFTVGALVSLTRDMVPTENQQNYLRAVQKYLNVIEPPFGVDPMAIENFENITTQKAILQVILEYLRLQDGDCYDETELQQSFLDAFSVNPKSRREIIDHVELLYIATGAKGLAEKYGYVPEDDLNMTASVSEINGCQSDECTSETPFDITKEFADTIFNCSSFSALDGIQGGAIETQDYIYSQEILFNKKTGEMAILSGKNLPETTGPYRDLYGVIGNKVYYFVNRQYGYGNIWKFNFSDCKAPQKLFAIAPGGISIWDQYLAFSDRDSGIFIYNIEKKQINKISDARNNGAIFASSKGVCYQEENSVYLYDYNNKTSSKLLKLPRNNFLSEIYNIADDSTMYISQYPNHADMAKIDLTKVDQNGMVCVEKFISDVMTAGGGTVINPYRDRIIYVADGGFIKSVDYKTEEISTLASSAKSDKYGHRAERFYRIGNWLYYYMDGDHSKLSRASLTCPGEVELIRELEYDEIKNMKAKIPEICFS